MPTRLPAGPYRMLQMDTATQVPWYIIPFDEQGRCEGPLTRAHLVAAVTNGVYTDILIFSHGWNNDWQDAVSSYEHFLAGYTTMRQAHHLTYPRPYKPLLIGIFWPSAALVMPWEASPQFAAAAGATAPREDALVEQERREVQALARLIRQNDVEQFYAFAQREGGLSEAEALEFARIMLPLYNNTSRDELPAGAGSTAKLSAEDLVQLWQAMVRRSQTLDTGDEGGVVGGGAAAPEAAGLLNFLNPREIIRAATVWRMKDRAGTVGAYGVGALLRDLLAAHNTPRCHLVGHSYGCKVVLSAVCFRRLPRQVNSLLLLQPAVSWLCFATDANGQGQPGGYRIALQRVEQPILTTFSADDTPLHTLFHLAVRRASDLGEMQIAGAPPSAYAALGGYGPGGCDADCKKSAIPKLGQPYDLGPGAPRIHALNGTGIICGHGDISNEATWWALYNQIAR